MIRVDVETFRDMNEEEMKNLVEGLKKIKGFSFLVRTPFIISVD